jgi:hypothetical protein
VVYGLILANTFLKATVMTTLIRFASKTLYHPETGVTLRGKISPVNLAIPNHLQLSTDTPTIVKSVWAEHLKAVLQEKEKQQFIKLHGEGIKFHDVDTCQVVLQHLLDLFTIDWLSQTLTTADKITLTKYKLWLKDVFLPLVNRVKQEQGKQVLEKAALKLWFETFESGPKMGSIYKSKLVNLVSVMGESENPEILEILLSDSFNAMIEFATAVPAEIAVPEFDCDI